MTDELDQAILIVIKGIGPYTAVAFYEEQARLVVDALEAAQAEVSQYRVDCFEAIRERNAALARLAELEKQEPVEIRYRSHYPSGPADGTRRIGDWRHIDYCTRNYGHNPVALENADAVEHLYAAAGASPVEPSQAQPPAPGEAAREYMTGYSVRRR